jgi:predicted PhzF superfamily epimerase YddE/YHI9
MSAPDRLNYDIIDVFTLASNEPFTGNALAVVYGAEQLTTKQMQTITNRTFFFGSGTGPDKLTRALTIRWIEFNLSETTFPMFLNGKKKEGGNEYDVRIFSIDEVSHIPLHVPRQLQMLM